MRRSFIFFSYEIIVLTQNNLRGKVTLFFSSFSLIFTRVFLSCEVRLKFEHESHADHTSFKQNTMLEKNGQIGLAATSLKGLGEFQKKI